MHRSFFLKLSPAIFLMLIFVKKVLKDNLVTSVYVHCAYYSFTYIVRYLV